MFHGFFRKADYILLAALIVIGVAVSVWLSSASSLGDKVVIKQDGKLYGTYSLLEDQTITIENGSKVNVIEIHDGEVEMASASCKNQVCVNHAAIRTSGTSIVCLPNRIMVTIEAEGGNEIDAVTS